MQVSCVCVCHCHTYIHRHSHCLWMHVYMTLIICVYNLYWCILYSVSNERLHQSKLKHLKWMIQKVCFMQLQSFSSLSYHYHMHSHIHTYTHTLDEPLCHSLPPFVCHFPATFLLLSLFLSTVKPWSGHVSDRPSRHTTTPLSATVLWADRSRGGICVSVTRYNRNWPQAEERDLPEHSPLHWPGECRVWSVGVWPVTWMYNACTMWGTFWKLLVLYISPPLSPPSLYVL